MKFVKRKQESSQSSWTSARGVTMYSINIKNNHVCTALTAVEANQRAVTMTGYYPVHESI